MTQADKNSTPTSPPGFLSRLSIAIGSFFKILADANFAGQVLGLQQGSLPVQPPAPAAAPAAKPASHDAALQLLGLLQRDARLIDFTQENLGSYSDADIGGAARVVHEGCCKVLREHFSLAPIRQEAEGSRITLNDGFDARAIRLTGNVVGSPPFQGSLSHRGWRATEVRLPQLTSGHDATVLAQAEVEL
ncbi:MAG: DUF2760 domain-containing protein [Rhodoferax sp.]